MQASSSNAGSLIAVLAALALIALVPLFGPDNRFLSLAISAGINVIALYGIGFWAALPAAGLAAAAFAAVVGVPSLRVSGHHFVIMTFAFGQLLTIVLTNGGEYTGAATGISILEPVTLFGVNMGAELPRYYVLVVAFVALAATASWAIINSRYGRTLRAIRENERLAASLGINVGRHKIGAFVVSGVYAGVSGVLLGYFLGHIAPQQFASFPSIYLALMVMIGGARLLAGPLAGGVLVAFLPEVLSLDPVESRIVYGVCLIAVILLLPEGLIAGLADGLRRLFRGRRAVEREASLPAPSKARQ